MPSSPSGVGGSPELLLGLTVAQQQAVTSLEPSLCVLAAAGSGKTTVLARRVARRILDGSAQAEHCLVVTFTRKASRELRDRLERLGVPGAVSAGTFHALAFAQLRRHWVDRDIRPLVVMDDPARVVRTALGPRAQLKPTQVAAVLGEIHWAQVSMVGPDDYGAAARGADRDTVLGRSHHDLAEVYAAYVAEKARRNVLDLDDLVARCASLLEEDRAAAAAQRWRIRHVFVDEFQDVNPAQWRLLKAWLGDQSDLFVVGDPRQAIYAWNGADPTLLDRLPELLPGTTVLQLDANHRSTPQVIGAARAVLGADPGKASRPDGPCPVVDGFDDDDDEAAAVTRWLRRAHRPGRPWSHLAVLARTNARLDPIARALERAGIPYRMGGDAKEAATARRALAELRRAPKTRHLRSALAELVLTRQARADEEGQTSGSDDGPESELGLPRALAQLADEHALEFPDATVGDFLDWIVAGGDSSMELDPVDGVELSTFHRSKGLEWPAVAVVGLEDGMVPIIYATTRQAIAEERRLLYVALTRAEDELWCSWARTRRAGDRTWRCDPSPLLAAVAEASRDSAEVPDTEGLSARIALLRTMLPEPTDRAS
ncbi:MAG TPA: ATP-dependent helicase [Acidimicrobiales bacterium]|nr:ATP-dependent helicase [Acidimicrobiales bacterium]